TAAVLPRRGRPDDSSGCLTFYSLAWAAYTLAQTRTHPGWIEPARRRRRRDIMKQPLNDEALDQLFREARTYNAWQDRPVSDETLRRLYELMKWGPTSANCCPARILFLRTPEAKERLRPALMPGNVDKTMQAPVTAIIAYDLRFYEQLPKLFPHNPGIRDHFAGSPELAEITAFRNGTLQG